MEKQIQSLKLNVTNIKSHLVNSNKQLRTLKVQKMNLVSKLEKQSEVRAKEDKLETKNLGIGSGFSNIIGAVTAPARSIFDNILEFFGLIALGVLVQKLPAIIAKNMRSPSLEFRTGRFASGVRVTDVMQTRRGFPSFGYTYEKNPYQTFEPGYKQGDTDRDPRKLIDTSIREIAATMAIGRFYTRRV